MNLPTHAHYVVIGGGIIGCSTAYHLARDHKADVILLEQNKLTSGSTWHAAGLVGQLRSSSGVTQLLKYSVELYKNLAAETGLDTGWRMTGCLRLATNQDRWIEYQRLATTALSFGMAMDLVSPAEAKRLWPLIDTSDLVGASWLPTDGQANPSDITAALAKGARMQGVKFHESTRVTGFQINERRITQIHTTGGTICCENVILCAGQWTRQISAMAGVNTPLQPVKHQYIITEKLDGITPDTPTLRDPDRRTYFKEEVGGLAMGGYEPNPIAWTTGDVPNDFCFQLFDDDWDHFEQHMSQAIARVPSLKTAGVKQMINGPESFTPDGNFILGSAPECTNLYIGAGFNAFGIASGGGAGWALAQWAAAGEAPLDLWAVDIRRFSDLHRDRNWVRDRTLEAYGKHYAINYPHTEYSSGRPRITSPLYNRLKDQGAVFGAKLGWERPNWFAPEGTEPRDHPGMGQTNWFPHVANEHHNTRKYVSLFDQSSFAKFELTGPDAEATLNWICANDVSKPPGSITYTQMLNFRGGIEGDLTVTRIEGQTFYIVTGTGFRTHDQAWIREHIPNQANATLTDVTEEWGTLTVQGPNARALLASLTSANIEGAAFPFAAASKMIIAGHTVRALRISYTGELGFELHCPIESLPEIFDALIAAGEPFGLKPAGYRAIESLRLEKAYLAWSADITPNETPLEAGLGWAVKLNKPCDFIGRAAIEQAAALSLKKTMACFTVDDPSITLLGRETILRNGSVAGYLTSGGFGHTIGKPIGLGYIRHEPGITNDFLTAGIYELIVANERIPATLHTKPLYDPKGARLRS